MANSTVSEGLKSLMLGAGAEWINWVLVALSALSLGVVLERAWVVWSRRDHLTELMQTLHARLLQHDYAGADILLRSRKGVEAAVAAAGLAQWHGGPRAVAEAMRAAKCLERSRLQRRLAVLSNVGTNAPFIGLLGTVMGVVGAFDSLGDKAGTASAAAMVPARVMSIIAEALVTTGLGLLVAIAAMATFHYLQNRVAVTMEGAETLGHILSSHVEEATYDARLSSMMPR